jgi:tRNA (cmo5U34)-methyltransferase
MEKTKSTVEEIRQRFDGDVERFSNLETGQSATMDAPLALDIIQRTAALTNPHAKAILDIGCGAGNFTLKILQALPNLDCTLIDLSQPMLDRAAQRVGAATRGRVHCQQMDIRDYQSAAEAFDIVVAAAVLHHLRNEAHWRQAFKTIHRALRPGGTFWVWDMICHDTPAVQQIMWQRFGDYLISLKGEGYRDTVFAYIDKEDTPASLNFQMQMAQSVGFGTVEVLHKTAVFAAYVAIK